MTCALAAIVSVTFVPLQRAMQSLPRLAAVRAVNVPLRFQRQFWLPLQAPVNAVFVPMDAIAVPAINASVPSVLARFVTN